MIPVDDITAKKNIFDLYVPEKKSPYNPWSKMRLRNLETKELLKCSPEKLDKILNELLIGLAPEHGPTELRINNKTYICYLDEKNPTLPHLFKVSELVGKGSYSQVFNAFAITLGKPCAYKIPVKLVAQPSPVLAVNLEKTELNEDQELSPIAKEESSEIQSANYVLYGELNNLNFLINTLKSNQPLRNGKLIKALLPIHNGESYRPFVQPLDKVEWDTRTELAFELGQTTLRKHLKYCLPNNFDPNDIWQYSIQLLSTLNLFEALEVVHTDVKSSNMVLQDGKIKLIDFDVLVKLPPDDNKPYVKQNSVPRTRLYITPAGRAKLRAATTNAEARKGWLYATRIAFAHTLFEILSLTPLKKKNEVNQRMPKVDTTKFKSIEKTQVKNAREDYWKMISKEEDSTMLDIRKMPNYKDFPNAIKNLLETLLDENVPPLDECIAAITEDVKKDYIEKTFKAMQEARPMPHIS